jgi:hypothetical protein
MAERMSAALQSENAQYPVDVTTHAPISPDLTPLRKAAKSALSITAPGR